MAAPPRLTPEQWAKVKHTWENDPRDSFEWLVRELGLPVAGAAVRKRAKAKGGEWQKQAKASPAKDSGAGNGGRVKRAENATKPAAQAKQESVRDLKGRGSAVGEPEGGEKSPPKGFRKGALPKRRKPVASDVVIDLATGEVDAGEGSQGSSDQGSESQGSQGSGHKWEMNLGDDEYLWRDVAPTVRPIEEDEKRGRPTVYQNIFPNQAFRHCLLGATTGDLALLFQVTERTINRWMVEHKEFCHAVQAGKADADSRVASSVFKRAVGFKVPEAHISNYKGHITITQVDKYYPPDMGAAALPPARRVNRSGSAGQLSPGGALPPRIGIPPGSSGRSPRPAGRWARALRAASTPAAGRHGAWMPPGSRRVPARQSPPW